MSDELMKLAERVEALSGPDREVDCAIDRLTFRGPFEARLCGCMGNCLPGHPAYDGACVSVPHYTASLDAAMTLVPEGMGWTAGWGQTRPDEPMGGAVIGHNARFIGNGENYDPVAYGESATVALALTAAALRAIAKDRGDG